MSDLEKMETELGQLTQQLASFLSLPPTERSTPGFAKIWRPISRYRVQLRSALQNSGSVLSDPRHRDSKRSEIEQRISYNAAHMRLRLWPRIEDLVNKQVTPVRQELMPQPSDYMEGAHNRYVNHLYSALHTLALPSAEAMMNLLSDAHPDIALPATHFEALMHAAYRICLAQGRDRPPRFLDVGCGGGTKIWAALPFFPESHGIENNPTQVRVGAAAMARLNVPENCIMEADARRFDDYANYDVIYFYRPLKDPDGLKEMEDQIMAQARPGTILIAPYLGFSAEQNDMRCSKIAPSVYIAGVAPYQVEALRARAEMIGTEAPGHDSASDAALGYWRSIVEASRRNGYAL
ncbi:hypothetical protein [Litoreibacter janthinus]|uniref:Methyltransferase domain-containing protein n=1 Tax=Litoreibacter janthinus TaxID=670154 RepID=A0A1I6G1W1_9RHOB|nr:hypothetical protein [Litoreibacter janthinus]SFR36166.1 hypothetical protein SAMN04488002_0754 [Litoreibacter janthinus]